MRTRGEEHTPDYATGLLAEYRSLMPSIEERIRWACALEVTAPKPGNVHPGQRFPDLTAADFLHGGDALATAVGESGGVGWQIRQAVSRTRQQSGSNVNLGVALLVVPLAAGESHARRYGIPPREALCQVLAGLSAEDSEHVYAAIRTAAPGGMGTVAEMDIHADPPADLLAAMRLASGRDSIARQYTTEFSDLFQTVVPALEQEIDRSGDMLLGIRDAHLRVMAQIPDTLIARKRGTEVAMAAAQRARALLHIRETAERRTETAAFDDWLRADGHARNPGTTADLIVAGLFILLGNWQR